MAFGLLLSTGAPAEETRSAQEPAETPAAKVEGTREKDESSAPREVRPALARRKRNALSQFDSKASPIDPKVFEARGRELQGQYYEIAGTVQPAPWHAGSGQASYPAENSNAGANGRAGASRNWMIWTGAAGLAAIVGGSVGYLMLVQHNAPEPLPVHLDDKP